MKQIYLFGIALILSAMLAVSCRPDLMLALDSQSFVLKKGESLMITPSISPEESQEQYVRWSSSDPTVATIWTDKEFQAPRLPNPALIYAVGEGQAVITAKVGSASATCDIIVFIPAL